jgi:hypothetical protein
MHFHASLVLKSDLNQILKRKDNILLSIEIMSLSRKKFKERNCPRSMPARTAACKDFLRTAYL